MERKYIIAIIIAIIVIVILIIAFQCRKGKGCDTKEPAKRKRYHGKLKNIKIEKAEGKTQVEWEEVPEVDHYVMYYSEEKGFDKTKASKHDPVEDNSMILGSDVPKGYYFRVSSVQKVDGKLVENELSDEHFMFLDAVSAE